MVAGVYSIVNKKTGQKYIGGSIDIERRIKEHVNKAGTTSYIHKAIQKHGFDSFDWQVIEELPADWEIIGEREKYWINFYNTFENPKHYNLTSGGERDFKLSEKTRKKLSESRKGVNNPFYNRKHTPESRKKISESLMGKEISKETRKKISESRKGVNNPFYNRKHTPESRKKMSESHMGKEISKETRKKISESQMGKEISKETRKKMSESHSQKRNTTGYYRVSKKNCNTYKQGFCYTYSYRDIDSKKRQISSVSLEKLEKKVKNAGLPWKILDEEKALKTLNEVSF